MASPGKSWTGCSALLNNIKMMHTVARYYNTPQRMTTLFQKVSNQIINNCKEYLAAPGTLWNQPKVPLLERLRLCVNLKEKYQQEYKDTRERLAQQPKGRQFDFDFEKIFAKLELFTKRLNKLIDMFTTIHQFNTLAETNTIDGMNGMIKRFSLSPTSSSAKPYDLLDYTKNQYDRDFLEFNVNIHDLETQLQDFINASFEHITSTEQALLLLRQFQSILQRESLKKDLDDKYMVIFQNYALDLDAVQKIYEKHKHSPSLPRNAPPVAGDIMWSRQLLRRIEEPMRKFATNETIMRTKESKRTVKTYNTVAKALVAFETLWLQAWIKSIESSKAGLQATLIVRHPETGGVAGEFRQGDHAADARGEVPAAHGDRGARVGEDGAVAGGKVQELLQPAELRAEGVRQGDERDSACRQEAPRASPGGPDRRLQPGMYLLDVDVHEHRRVPHAHPRGAGEA